MRKSGPVLAAVSAAAALLGAAACEEESPCVASFSEVGGPEAPCTVTTADERAISHTCYAEPQICPHISPIQFCDVQLGSREGYNVLLLNRGEKPYTIKGLLVRNDANCTIKDLRIDPGFEQQVEGGDAAILHFKYEPSAESVDQITIEVITDAENFPSLYIPVCGRGTGSPGEECVACEDTSTAEHVDCSAQE